MCSFKKLSLILTILQLTALPSVSAGNLKAWEKKESEPWRALDTVMESGGKQKEMVKLISYPSYLDPTPTLFEFAYRAADESQGIAIVGAAGHKYCLPVEGIEGNNFSNSRFKKAPKFTEKAHLKLIDAESAAEAYAGNKNDWPLSF